MIGSLVRDADVALYRAKHNGRGRVEIFTPSLNDESAVLVTPHQL